MFEKKASSTVPISEILAQRWSGRAYNPARPVAAAELAACLEAARWAPSCSNAQPWRYIVCSRSEDPAAWQNALACLSEGNRTWAQNAPALILAVAEERFGHKDQANRWAQYDTGAASLSLCLQAAALGMMSHQMGGFDAAEARTVFSIPKEYTPMAIIALGYQLAEENIPAALQAREFAPRQRRPAHEHVFSGHWGRHAGESDNKT